MNQKIRMGNKYCFTGMEAENNNKVHVCIEVESMDKLQEFMQIPDNAKVIEEAGVKLETQVMIPIIE